MKKVLSVIGLIAILGMTTPVIAAPPGHAPGHRPHGAPGMHAPMHHGGHVIHTGAPRYHHPRPHGGVVIHSGYPRHGYWGGYRPAYWGSSWCDYRLGWCDDYYYRPCRPLGGFGVSIRF